MACTRTSGNKRGSTPTGDGQDKRPRTDEAESSDEEGSQSQSSTDIPETVKAGTTTTSTTGESAEGEDTVSGLSSAVTTVSDKAAAEERYEAAMKESGDMERSSNCQKVCLEDINVVWRKMKFATTEVHCNAVLEILVKRYTDANTKKSKEEITRDLEERWNRDLLKENFRRGLNNKRSNSTQQLKKKFKGA